MLLSSTTTVAQTGAFGVGGTVVSMWHTSAKVGAAAAGSFSAINAGVACKTKRGEDSRFTSEDRIIGRSPMGTDGGVVGVEF